MKNYVMALGLTLSSLGALAQQAATETATKTEYFDKTDAVLPSAEGADYRKVTEPDASGGGTVRTFFVSGKPRSLAVYEDLDRHIVHGTSEGWYESGQLSWRYPYEHGKAVDRHESFYQTGQVQYRQLYVAGKREGELVLYYPDGTLKRQEMYVDNERTTGVCYNNQGQEIAFSEYEVMPVFPGGQEALLRYIGQNTHYPGKALRRNVQGKVFVKFIVDTTGQVQQVMVSKGVDALLDAEALRVVQGIPKFIPGRQDGRPVRVYFTVPITFAINNTPLFRRRPPQTL
ncbi:energy transducer TonB [Hymenobacter swuensis]|nr:energy transducer TonB [Hymenobacter swuensis]